MRVEEFINTTKKEIEQLREDTFYATNRVTHLVIERAIKDRELVIERVKETYRI